MTTYPGLPGPDISSHVTFVESWSHYSTGTEFSIGRISMVANTGTYLDTPAHRFREGDDLRGLPLERCAMVPAVVVDADGEVGPDVFGEIEAGGCAVSTFTGRDRRKY